MKITEINYSLLTHLNEAYSAAKELLKKDPQLTGVIILLVTTNNDEKRNFANLKQIAYLNHEQNS